MPDDVTDSISEQHTARTRRSASTRPRRSPSNKAHPGQLNLGDMLHWGLPADRYGRTRLLSIYLGGPIAGSGYSAASDWRVRVAEHLGGTSPHIRVLDPMRGKHELKDVDRIEAGQGGVAYGPRTTVGRDLWDVNQCDAVLINLSNATEVSIGSMVELGYACAHGKFVVVVLPSNPESDPHNHPFVTETATAVVRDLTEGIRLLEDL